MHNLLQNKKLFPLRPYYCVTFAGQTGIKNFSDWNVYKIERPECDHRFGHYVSGDIIRVFHFQMNLHFNPSYDIKKIIIE